MIITTCDVFKNAGSVMLFDTSTGISYSLIWNTAERSEPFRVLIHSVHSSRERGNLELQGEEAFQFADNLRFWPSMDEGDDLIIDDILEKAIAISKNGYKKRELVRLTKDEDNGQVKEEEV
jgi:hypothetical protein